MEKHYTIAAAIAAILATIIGATVSIENRYAKSAEVKEQLQEYYAKNLKLRILEINLKTNLTPADRALLQYLNQELQKSGSK